VVFLYSLAFPGLNTSAMDGKCWEDEARGVRGGLPARFSTYLVLSFASFLKSVTRD